MKEILQVRLYNVPEAAALLGVTSLAVAKNSKEVIAEALQTYLQL